MKNDRRLKLIMAIGILVIGLVMFILNYIFHLELWFALLVYLLMTAIIIFGIYGIAYTGGRLIYMQF